MAAIKDEDLGTGEKPDWIVVPATVNYIRSENGCVPSLQALNKAFSLST